jgi:hypothetical protein
MIIETQKRNDNGLFEGTVAAPAWWNYWKSWEIQELQKAEYNQYTATFGGDEWRIMKMIRAPGCYSAKTF